MSSPQQFVNDVLPDAQIASSRTGVPVSVILAQWANETGWGSSPAFTQGNNYAGVSPGGSVGSYPSRSAGLAAYIQTLLSPLYAAVRSAGSAAGAAVALGQSPWAGSRYDNAYYGQGPGGPGSILLGEISANNLTRYDTAGPTTSALHIPGLGDLPGGVFGFGAGPLFGLGGSGSGPVGNVAGDIANAVTSSLVGAIREPALKAVGTAGAVGLLLLAAWQVSKPVRDQVEEKAGQAAKVAAVAA